MSILGNDCVDRRNFIKITAAGAAGLSVAEVTPLFAKTAQWKAINPAISNMRVVCCHDTTMLAAATPTSFTFDTTNNAANAAKIEANLDLMAMSLAQKTTAAEAWQTIFQKPAAKTWAQVKVAIKINVINSFNQPRVAIVGKICKVLNGFGVPAVNIVVYDGCAAGKNANAAQTTLWAAKFSTTDTAKYPAVVSNLNGSLGGTMNAAVPVLGNRTCTTQVANGTIDILVNCSVNKGHATYAGGTTLSCKNHFGTFAPDHGGVVMDNIIGFNKSDAIVGGTPTRQQLCIVDSLLADTNNNPDNAPTQRIDRLVMGTFGPIVDYQTAINIRKAIMIVANKGPDNHDWTAIGRYLTDFGYATTDPLQWVNVDPNVGIFSEEARRPAHSTLEVTLSAGTFKQSSARFSVPASAGPASITIHDMNGRTVREFGEVSLAGNRTALRWDGKSSSGAMSAAGAYIVKVKVPGFERSERVTLAR
jgi:hypothetical protein